MCVGNPTADLWSVEGVTIALMRADDTSRRSIHGRILLDGTDRRFVQAACGGNFYAHGGKYHDDVSASGST